MKTIYYPDHDERYAHIPKSERWKYPDEIKIGFTRIKRVKNYADLTGKDVRQNGGVSSCFIAKDIPYTEGLE